MMTATLALLIVGVGWLVIGVATGVVMGRRGHDPFAWLLVGVLLGPLALPPAVAAARHPDLTRPRRLLAGAPADGRVGLLVGIDGSAQAAAALDAALDVLGARLGRLTLAAVTDVDATVAHDQEEARLRQELQRQADRAQARLTAAGVPATAELLLLRGRPAHALLEQAAAGGYGLLAVGTRGAGLTPRLLGSIAESLATGTTVPVLLASDGRSTPPPPGSVAIATTGSQVTGVPVQPPANHQPTTACARPHEIPARAW
jgi:nucleotide-binding universal stress UspA family protein